MTWTVVEDVTPKKAARAYGEIGQPVFPCYSRGERAKSPLTKRGLHDATTASGQIKTWWKRWPEAAIGLPTGVNFDVLDVDVKGETNGAVHLSTLQRLGLLDGCKFVVATPSGGWHLYFTASGIKNKSNANLGLDVRGLGGYVLSPGSVLDTGSYRHLGDTKGSTDDPIHWDLIVSALMPTNEKTNEAISLLPSERRASVAHLREWVLNLKVGERNNGFHWAVCRCIDNRIDPWELAEVALETGLSEHEVKATIGSALRRAGVHDSELDSEAEAMFGRD